MITTTEAARRLGVTPARVRALIASGRLPSQQFGRDHLIKESDLALVKDRKPGRPVTNKPAKTSKSKKAKRKEKGTK